MFPYDNNYCSYKNMGDEKSIFTTSDNQVTTSSTPSDNSTSSDSGGTSIGQGSGFSPLAPPFQSRINMDLMSMMQQEPQVGDTAPSNLGLDFMNLRMGDSESLYDDRAEQNDHNYFMGSRTESVASPAPTSGNIWTNNNNHSYINSNDNKNDTIDFFLKTFAVANTYASMLTREQTSVLKDLRPGLIYEFLHDIIRIRSEKRMQRALPNECAFCKNNGENEEKYASHALKDWKGRVQCPVLRAFRCPRCGATGDRAHTIKYCPVNDHGMDRQGPFQQRRRNSFMFGESSRPNYGAATPSFSAQSNPTQFNAAHSNPPQFNPTQFNPTQFNEAQTNPTQSPDSTFSYASFWSNLSNSN